MGRLALLAGLLFAASANAGLTPYEYVTAPGGKTVYYILGEDSVDKSQGGMLISVMDRTSNKNEPLLLRKLDGEPKKNLEGFKNLKLSPDAKTLYFQSNAWATSDAIHSIDIKTKKTTYITAGSLACVVGGGEYQGDLIVSQHRYFIQGGSYDFLYLFDKTGKEIGLIGTDGMTKEALLTVCQSVG